MSLKIKILNFSQKIIKDLSLVDYALMIMLLVITIGVYKWDSHREANRKSQPPLTAQQIEEQRIDNLYKDQFSSWDGSHTKLVEIVKKQLKDPDSFQHIKTDYITSSYQVRVVMEYRAKNSFGGYEVGYADAIFNPANELVSIKHKDKL